MKKRFSTRDLVIGIIFIFIFVLATMLQLFGVIESYQQFVAVLLSAAATYVIVAVTMGSQAEQQKALMEKQSESEEVKEKNTKVFEEKLRIYQDFLHCLCEVIKDGEVTAEEAIQLQFQTSYITMHTSSEHIKKIAYEVSDIVDNLKSDKNSDREVNTAEKAFRDNGKLMEHLFNIVKEFREELYQYVPTEEDEANSKEAVAAFSNIMNAVEVSRKADDNVDAPANIEQVMADFANDLLKKINANGDYWKAEAQGMEAGVYLNFAKLGNEDGVRVMLNHEDNGEHYLQVHMDYADTHEAYKHMKWRFGGRQNKWSWWRYLDKSYRLLAFAEPIRTHDWEHLTAAIAKQVQELLEYVATFQKVTQEILDAIPVDKAKVWMYYEKCVAFDFDKVLGNDHLFMDVFLCDDGLYCIDIGNRDGDKALLLDRLNALGFNDIKDQDLDDGRIHACQGLSAEQAVGKMKEFTTKIIP